MKRTSAPVIALGISLALTSPALAGDGRPRINQACAAAGCFSGDAPGLPVSIDGSAGSSYVLAGDLIVADPDVSAIEITAEDVTLDLNGFELAGPVTCTGSGGAIACDPGTGNGVGAAASNGVVVRNGRVRGFGGYGLVLGERARVERVLAVGNGLDGIHAEAMSMAIAATSEGNGGDGIELYTFGIFDRSIARANGGHGIFMVSRAVAVSNVARENGQVGVRNFGSCVVRDNSAVANEGDGFATSNGSLFTDNSAIQNDGRGFVGSSGTLLRRNVSRANGDVGIQLLLTSSYAENAINENVGGTVTGGIDLGGNVCDGSLTCP